MWDVTKKRSPLWHSGQLMMSLLVLGIAATRCDLSEDDKDKIDQSFNNPPTGGGSAPSPRCEAERHHQPEAQIDKKLDLLFVVDTSGSLDTERQDIADGIDAFIQALPTEIDLQIAVMLAHGESVYSGRLFQKRSEPHVLRSTELTLSEIRTHLLSKLSRPPGENSTDGGETGFVSLRRSMTESALLDEIQLNHQFYRDGAALAVIFVADENEICATYPSGVDPVFDPNGKEVTAKARLCGSTTTTLIDHHEVYRTIKTFKQDDPLLIAGIIYNDLQTVPSGGENEYGYGYSDLVQIANGISVDLASGNYEPGLREIGELVTVTLDLQREFTLTRTDIDPDSLQVFVDGDAVPFSFTPPDQVNLTGYAGIQLSEIEIQYCLQNNHPKVAALCQNNDFEPKNTIRVGLSVDPNESSATIIESGLTTIGYAPTVYSDQEIIHGNLIADQINVLFIARKVTLAPVDVQYITAIEDYIANGGSVIGEFDGAALFFTDFIGNEPILQNFNPNLGLFTAEVSGGGALIPIPTSTTYITNTAHPVTQGLPNDFLVGLRTAFAITDADIEWLEPLAQFVSDGSGRVPEGTYPAILAGRCNRGRVVLIPMNHLQSTTLSPVDRLVENSIRWVAGQ